MSIELFNDQTRELYGSDDVFAIMSSILKREIKIQKRKDYVWLIALNKNLCILFIERLPIHRIEKEKIEPARFFKFPVMFEATGIILAHSHEDEGISPTTEDLHFTSSMQAAGDVLKIEMLDHIIFNTKDFFSFTDNEIIKKPL